MKVELKLHQNGPIQVRKLKAEVKMECNCISVKSKSMYLFQFCLRTRILCGIVARTVERLILPKLKEVLMVKLMMYRSKILGLYCFWKKELNHLDERCYYQLETTLGILLIL